VEGILFYTLNKNRTMKYVAEQDRKFTDMGGVKIHHSIYPVVYPVSNNGWCPVIKFDNKAILAGRQEVQSFVGGPVQIIRVMINGSASYYDSTGYRAVLNNNDILSVNIGSEVLESVLDNADESEDNELIEIWFESHNSDIKYQYHASPANKEAGSFYTLMAPEQTDEEDNEQKKWFRIGTFRQGGIYEIKDFPARHSIIVFVLNGAAMANGNRLAYRDTIIFCGEDIRLEFESNATIFFMEMEISEINKEAIK
jgi:redox-sensitive bicupin YhaK (pirin superfamily)